MYFGEIYLINLLNIFHRISQYVCHMYIILIYHENSKINDIPKMEIRIAYKLILGFHYNIINYDGSNVLIISLITWLNGTKDENEYTKGIRIYVYRFGSCSFTVKFYFSLNIITFIDIKKKKKCFSTKNY